MYIYWSVGEPFEKFQFPYSDYWLIHNLSSPSEFFLNDQVIVFIWTRIWQVSLAEFFSGFYLCEVTVD